MSRPTRQWPYATSLVAPYPWPSKAAAPALCVVERRVGWSGVSLQKCHKSLPSTHPCAATPLQLPWRSYWSNGCIGGVQGWNAAAVSPYCIRTGLRARGVTRAVVVVLEKNKIRDSKKGTLREIRQGRQEHSHRRIVNSLRRTTKGRLPQASRQVCAASTRFYIFLL